MGRLVKVTEALKYTYNLNNITKYHLFIYLNILLSFVELNCQSFLFKRFFSKIVCNILLFYIIYIIVNTIYIKSTL